MIYVSKDRGCNPADSRTAERFEQFLLCVSVKNPVEDTDRDYELNQCEKNFFMPS